MKGFRLFTKSLMFVLILSALAFAQTETTPPGKIAVINTAAFEDKETGIKEIAAAYDKIEAEFKPQAEDLKLVAEKIQNLKKEIEEFEVQSKKYRNVGCPISIEKKLEEYDKLTKEYKQKQEEAKNLYDKRKPEIFADVNKIISEALKQFAKDKGYVAILDVSKCADCLTGNFNGEDNDVTAEFIKYYNENFAKTKTQ